MEESTSGILREPLTPAGNVYHTAVRVRVPFLCGAMLLPAHVDDVKAGVAV